MIRKLTAFVLIAVIAVVLPSCSLFSDFSPDSLVRAPKLTGDDALIQSVFESSVGKDVILVNPLTGKYRSSFVQFDIDLDGEDETIVFYAKSDAPADLHVHFMKFDGNNWFSVGDLLGYGSAINNVDFLNLDRNSEFEVAVTWTLADSKRNKSFAVYRMGQARDNYRVNQLLALQIYDYQLLDFDFDGQLELFYLFTDSAEPNEGFSAGILKYSETSEAGFIPLCQVRLSDRIESPDQILYDVRDGQYRLYIDASTYDGDRMTEILYYQFNDSVIIAPDPNDTTPTQTPQSTVINSPVLVRPTDTEGSFLCEKTHRMKGIDCEDLKIGGKIDYMIEIPTVRTDQRGTMTSPDSDEPRPFEYVSYVRFNGSEFMETGQSFFFDPDGRFRFEIDRLLDFFTPSFDEAKNEIRFYSSRSLSIPVLTVDFNTYFNSSEDDAIIISSGAPSWLTKNLVQSLIQTL